MKTKVQISMHFHTVLPFIVFAIGSIIAVLATEKKRKTCKMYQEPH